MTDPDRIRAVLSKIASLLRAEGNDYWASSMEGFAAEMAVDPVGTPPRILLIFGGMGSFNDLVLHRDGQMLAKENDSLDALRVELYRLCRS